MRDFWRTLDFRLYGLQNFLVYKSQPRGLRDLFMMFSTFVVSICFGNEDDRFLKFLFEKISFQNFCHKSRKLHSPTIEFRRGELTKYWFQSSSPSHVIGFLAIYWMLKFKLVNQTIFSPSKSCWCPSWMFVWRQMIAQ